MKRSLPQLSLILQSVELEKAGSGDIAQAAVDRAVVRFSQDGFWTPPIERTIRDETRTARFESFDTMRRDFAQWTGGLYRLEAAADGTSIELSGGPNRFDLICAVPLVFSATKDLLGSLLGLALQLWTVCRGRSMVGPVFGVRPLGLPYPRPRPPRHSPVWTLGDAAYLIDDDFHRAHPLGEPESVARLKARPLKAGILREVLDGLTVVRCSGPADEGSAFAQQRHDLEVWMSAALELPLHPEFCENGDRRLTVQARAGAPPFTLYDPMRNIGFMAVAPSATGGLDEATRGALENVLRIRDLPDNRRVRETMVIFPTREAAVANLEAVRHLGASGVVYVGEDGRLLNPDPPGSWIPVDWRRV